MPRFSGSAPAQAPPTLAPTPRRRLDECVDRLHRAASPFATVPAHRSADSLLRRLTAIERSAGWAGLIGVLDAALRS